MNENRLALAENPEPMEIRSSEEMDHDAFAAQLDQQALAMAAEEQTTIASIGGRARTLLEEVVQRGELSPEDKSLVQQKLNALHQDRMTEIRGDTRVRAANLGPNTLGVFDGNNISLNPNGGIENSIYEHERDHEKKGFSGNDLDQSFAPDTGIDEIDEQFDHKEQNALTERSVLEVSATEAERAVGGDGSNLYQEQYVEPMSELEARGDAAGVDIAGAHAAFLRDRDQGAFQAELIRLAATEAAQEGDMEDLQESAEESEDEAVREIVAEVRNEFENGPDAEKKQEELVSLAA